MDRVAAELVRRFHDDQLAAESEQPRVVAMKPDSGDVDRRMVVGLLAAAGWTTGPTLRIPADELGEEIAERHRYHESGRNDSMYEVSTGDDYFFWMPVPHDIAAGLMARLQCL